MRGRDLDRLPDLEGVGAGRAPGENWEVDPNLTLSFRHAVHCVYGGLDYERYRGRQNAVWVSHGRTIHSSTGESESIR